MAVMTLQEAAEWARKLKASGKTLAVTNGAFDLLHRGHVEYLTAAAANADHLLVAMNSDASVRILKGPERPIVCQEDRAYLLDALECVSAVTMFDEPKACEVFRVIHPDVYVKGGDYTEDSLDREEHALLASAGAKFVFIPFVQGRSTTSVIKQIRTGATGPAVDRGIAPLLSRRSVRRFQLRPVGDELLRSLLAAGGAAPSACRKDPWHFVVIKDKLPQLAACLPNGGFLKEAPLGIVVCGDLAKAQGGELSYLLQDCSAAVMNILHAANMLWLGACCLGIHPRQERIEK
ncbi:MAG: nitroreductase family protein, partial [Victivallales bacterium]|nr:nitroreductase family protein [Victivallales bacterium]